ncbi:low molecular weight protein-tyrosine-phosphatase [Sphingomonas baiyangensis]|uniref:protein-tyrosine-phosphatase n=1 Tax=Sphingomonas baiyangensis TaxID=2572576 RepID=A0A4V5PUY9_9SPHN|nr:low molecular weight protein-tyrosine-phosphatase [Sphingomonas baiyangensis]TKD52018.1 low molecular weight phosphotyrosine protein phosphatase [Sphingomonas baiyangensis]
MATPEPAVLFVCLGNICRSPLAKAAMRAEADRRDVPVRVDSAGTGDWHVGQPPDRRAITTAERAGLDIKGYRARQFEVADFYRFTHIVALDRSNRSDIESIRPDDATAQVSLLLDHVPGREGEDVFDPYTGGDDAFAETLADVTLGASALVDAIAKTRTVMAA